jgi:hypothetical protein
MRAAITLIIILLALPLQARDSTPFWTQGFDIQGSPQAYSSSYRTNTGYWMFCADDFQCEVGDTLTMVEWWGLDNSGGDMGQFFFRIYENDSSGRYNLPGATIYDETSLDFTTEFVEGTGLKYHYTCVLPVPFVAPDTDTYWLSIIATHPSQQWYWNECVEEDYWGEEGVMRSDFWGEPDWVSLSTYYSGMNYTEFSMILYSGGDTPVRNGSWADIKAMYR